MCHQSLHCNAITSVIREKAPYLCGLFYISRYSEYKINDYHLETLIEENLYFIVSPKDIIVASLYENDDRVKWLIDHG